MDRPVDSHRPSLTADRDDAAPSSPPSGRASPPSAILTPNNDTALDIVPQNPLALRGVRDRAVGAASLLRRNLLIYGLGGIVVPFAGIKAIDLAVSALGLA